MKIRLKMPGIRTAELLAVAVLIVVVPAHAAIAESIKLKDGTTLEGVVLAEDDRQITLEVQFASGTITAKRTIQKSDIAEIVRPTAEERTQREMEKAYQTARKLRLDPSRSLPLQRYDEAINGVFLPFFAQYPNSSYEKELSELMTDWRAERELVTAGKAKFHGEWMPAPEAAKRAEDERVGECLRRGRALLGESKYDQALQQLRAAGPLTVESHGLQTQAYESWLSTLEHDRRRLSNEVRSATSCIADSKREVAYAEKNLASYREQARAYRKKSTSADAAEQSYVKTLERAKTKLNECESQLSLAWNQLGIAERDIAGIKMRYQALGPVPSASQPVVALEKSPSQPSASSPPETSKPLVTRNQRAAPPTAYGTERPMPAPVPSGEEFMSVLNSKVSNTEPPVSTVGVGRWKIPSPFQLIYDVMTGKGTMITIVGLVITIVGTLWLLAAAFIEGIFWGLACVAIPFANVVFGIVHFREAKWPLLVTVVGWFLMYAGVYGS